MISVIKKRSERRTGEENEKSLEKDGKSGKRWKILRLIYIV